MTTAGYYRFPTLHGQTVVFVCEDDLWSVPDSGSIARRLTSGLGEASYPFLSPDGATLAFIGREEGHTEVYVMPALGGPARRLTYLGSITRVVGWSPDGESILFMSHAGQPFLRLFKLFTVGPDGQPAVVSEIVGGLRESAGGMGTENGAGNRTRCE